MNDSLKHFSIEELQELRSTHQRNLFILESQAVKYTSLEVKPHILTQINESKKSIEEIDQEIYRREESNKISEQDKYVSIRSTNYKFNIKYFFIILTISSLIILFINYKTKNKCDDLSFKISNTDNILNDKINYIIKSQYRENILYLATIDGFLFKSNNYGYIWSEIIIPDINNINTIALDDKNQSILYLATDTGVLKTNDNGMNWTFINSGLTSLDVKRITIDPIDHNTLYASTWGGGFKSIDGGTTWYALNTPVKHLPVQNIAINPSNPSKIYITTHKQGFYYSNDGGNSWNITSFGLNIDIRHVIFSPTDSETMFMTTGNEGIFKSTNGGVDWVPSSTGLPDLQIRSDISVQPMNGSYIMYVGTWGGGLFYSFNEGDSWKPIDEGLLVVRTIVGSESEDNWILVGSIKGLSRYKVTCQNE